MRNELKPLCIILLFCLSRASGVLAEPIRVVVSISPQAQFVERVGGDRVAVTVMVPPGASPPTYDPKPSQLKEIDRARLYLQIGAGFVFEKAWMGKILSINPNLTVVDGAADIDLVKGHDGDARATDPHVWLSPRRVKIIAANICRALSKIDPDHAAFYARNRDTYCADLDSLDAGIARTLAEKKPRAFLVYHPAWTYFARDYGLEQIAVEREGKDPTPRGLADLIRLARQRGLTTVFVSPEFNASSADVIAGELGGRVTVISPLARDYLQNMRRVARAIAAQ